MEESTFKHLEVPRCGPHCIAKDNGSGNYVSVRHCDQCHEEYDYQMVDRPAHGINRFTEPEKTREAIASDEWFADAVKFTLPVIVDDFKTKTVPLEHIATVLAGGSVDMVAMSEPLDIGPHFFNGRSDRWCTICNRPDRNPIHIKNHVYQKNDDWPAFCRLCSLSSDDSIHTISMDAILEE